jgi:hypothetical protein
MKKLEIRNEELIQKLDEFIEYFAQKGTENINVKGEPDENEYHTSEEYYQQVHNKNHIGYPEESYGVDFIAGDAVPKEWREDIKKFKRELSEIIVSPQCAVQMYYPPGGYMGWHDNHNAPGYNILLSYTKNGKGFFRYKDPQTKETVTLYDEPGWTAKVGYYGYGMDDPEGGEYWHCARAFEDERFTLGFIVPDKGMWEMMIEDIETP